MRRALVRGGNAVVCACSDGTLRVVDPFKGAVTHTLAGASAGARKSEKIADGMSVAGPARHCSKCPSTHSPTSFP